MQGGNEAIEEEMREVQKEIDESQESRDRTQLQEMEEGKAIPNGNNTESHKGSGISASSLVESMTNLLSLILSPILIQSFVMTFLAEWGDRSQITTIALGAAHVSSHPKINENYRKRFTPRMFG